jgi:ATP-dependent helicase/nuclease subunit A
VLTEHIAVMDLMVLADALLLPDDDLALATVLRGPLFGLDDEQLFELAFARRGTLRAVLAAKAGDPRFADTVATLDRLARAARRDTPFDFYARLLGAQGGRQRFLARLGHEAADALDEFLNLALDYESRETPSLQGFVAWLRAARTEIKRDMDIVRDEVRVMTVHGAKGLEAPVVILADTTTRPTGPRDPRLLALPALDAPPGAPDCLVWAGARDTDVAAVAQARETARRAAEHEYRRLLYVAMTRAADRLIVCAAQGLIKRPPGCWYDLVCNALSPAAAAEPADDGEGNVWRWRKVAAGPARSFKAGDREARITELPRWLSEDAPAAPPAPRLVSPSRAIDDDVVPRAGAVATTRADALARGLLVHRLMQSLPDIGLERRRAAAQRYLARNGAALDEAEREAICQRVLAVLDDPRFAPLFATGTRAEVPLVGRIAQPGSVPLTVSGQVDRLVVTPTAVLIADYKTNAPAPRAIEEVPRTYLVQLALYRLLLRKIYPTRQVRAALIWTEIPDLMELPDAVLDAALAAMGTDVGRDRD